MDDNSETPVDAGGSKQETPQPPPAYQEQPLQPEIVDVTYDAPPQKRSNGWIIALIVILVLCCCCIFFWIPLSIFGRVFASIFSGIYQAVISILNSIFGGTVQFY
jgi:hypothetical protein